LVALSCDDWLRNGISIYVALIALWVVALPLGGWIVLRLRGRLVPMPTLAVIALQWAYVANATFCLVMFWRDRQLGAIFTLATVVVYVLQTVFAAVRAGRRGAEGEVIPTQGGRT
jgi:hypothetical protein